MFQVSRMYFAAALCLLAAGAVSAAVEPDLLVQRKLGVVHAALENQGDVAEGNALVRAAATAEALVDIQLEGSAARPVIVLHVTGEPAAKPFMLDGRKRFVIDLLGTVNLQGGKTIEGPRHAVIRRVRTSLFALEPELASRVVVDLLGPCSFTIQREEDRIRIAFLPEDGALEQEDVAPQDPPALVALTKELHAHCALAELNREMTRLRADTVQARTGHSVPAALSQMRGTLHALYEATAPAVKAYLRAAAQQDLGAREPILVAHTGTPPKPVAAARLPIPRVSDPIARLTRELEAVRMSHFDLTVAQPRVFAAVAQEADAQETAEGESAGSKENAPKAAPNDKKPKNPKNAAGKATPPPDKRNAAEEAPRKDAPVITRMKSLLSGVKVRTAEPEVQEAQDLKGPGAARRPKARPRKPGEPPQAPEPKSQIQPKQPAFVGNPLDQIVDIDFRDMDLENIVALLAQKAQINVIGGP